jgi:hypothetical protein
MRKLKDFLFKILRKISLRKKIGLIIIVGLVLRLMLAKGNYNFDIVQFTQIGHVMRSFLNIYEHNQFYNYSPLFFFVLGLLDRVQSIFNFPSFPFIERAFLSLIDIFTFFIIFKIAKQRNLPPLKTATLFYLNPISIIISGHHGQFDNIAILLLLIGVYFSQKNAAKKIKNRLVFVFLTLSLLMKHVIVFQVFYFMKNFYKNKRNAFLLFMLACFVFLLALLPFVSSSFEQIIKRVFLYGGVQGLYGFSYFLTNIFTGWDYYGITIQTIYKPVFILGYFLFVLLVRQKDILRGTLLTVLFFLTFTSGIGAQYFVLPIALGTFFPTRWFYLYTLTVTLFFLGSFDELNIYTFKVFEWNTVWLFTIFWFLSEIKSVNKILSKLIKEDKNK